MSQFDKCLADDTRTRNLRVLFSGWEEGRLVCNFAGELNLNLQDTAVDLGCFFCSIWLDRLQQRGAKKRPKRCNGAAPR